MCALVLLGHYDQSSEPTVAAFSDCYWSRASIDYAAVPNRTGAVVDTSGPAYECLAREQDASLQCLNGTIAGSVAIYDPLIELMSTSIPTGRIPDSSQSIYVQQPCAADRRSCGSWRGIDPRHDKRISGITKTFGEAGQVEQHGGDQRVNLIDEVWETTHTETDDSLSLRTQKNAKYCGRDSPDLQ